MQVVILAGTGPRFAEKTDRIPKPMVPIGPQPILWHIIEDLRTLWPEQVRICGGYRIQSIIEYFANFRLHTSDISIDISNNELTYLNRQVRKMACNHRQYRRSDPDRRTPAAHPGLVSIRTSRSASPMVTAFRM